MVNVELLNYVTRNSIEFCAPVLTNVLVSFSVGGTGDIAVFPKNLSELKQILSLLSGEKLVVLGNGTNCYFTDGNFDGVIIVTSRLNKISLSHDIVTAECGASVKDLCMLAMENSLSGLEFAYGIPGTVGGAVCMNASAFGGCFADVVLDSKAYDISKGTELNIDLLQHCFGTKASVFRGSPLCHLSARFKLRRGDKSVIASKMEEYLNRRKATQPLDFPSGGSAFVKPKDAHASYLIDKAGLKGVSFGGAAVSCKHAGFIVNTGGAKARDIRALIEHIKTVVLNEFNIYLQEEIIYLE